MTPGGPPALSGSRLGGYIKLTLLIIKSLVSTNVMSVYIKSS